MGCCIGVSVKGLGERARQHFSPGGREQEVLVGVVAIGYPAVGGFSGSE